MVLRRTREPFKEPFRNPWCSVCSVLENWWRFPTGHERLQLQGNPSSCSGRLLREESGNWTSVPWSAQKDAGRLDAWCQRMNCGTSAGHQEHGGGTNLTCSGTSTSSQPENHRLFTGTLWSSYIILTFVLVHSGSEPWYQENVPVWFKRSHRMDWSVYTQKHGGASGTEHGSLEWCPTRTISGSTQNLSNQGSLENQFLKEFSTEPIQVPQRTFQKLFFKAPFLVPRRTFQTRVL